MVWRPRRLLLASAAAEARARMVGTEAPVAACAAAVRVAAVCEHVQLVRSGQSQGYISGMRRPSLPLSKRIIRMDEVPAAMLPQVVTPVVDSLGAVL